MKNAAATRKIVLVMLGFCCAVPAAYAPRPAAAYENLGRLFFTPQQRQDLDRRRRANVLDATISTERSVTVNGQVSRSSGRTTTWLNGVPLESARSPRDPARVTLPGEGETSVTVKIGQTLDKARGEVKDPVEGGRIVVPADRARRP
jgi:hypothetical protein